MTECNQSSFGFETSGRREIVARFDGGTISSDGGAFLLRQADKRLNLIGRLAECFLDGRNQSLVEHSIPEMLSQRIYGLALGYEDLNDHEQLRTGRFFHGYYDNYCYLPLYVFCGDHVLCARLREANHDAAFGCLQEMQRIVRQIRAIWPEVKIVLRRGFRLLPQRTDELGAKTIEWTSCLDWHATRGCDGSSDNRCMSDRAVEADRQSGTRVQRIRIQHEENQEERRGP